MQKEDHYVINNCGVCGSSNANAYLSDGIYTVNKCLNCNSYWVSPRLKEEKLKEIYQTIYWNSDSPKDIGYADYLSKEKLYYKTFKRRLKNINPYINSSTKKVLDIGCSNGVFLRLMNENGWEGVGVDISEYIISEAKKRTETSSIEYRCGYLQDVLNKEDKFDLITMWDVIEHVEDPIKILKHINKHLNHDGVLILETQNIKSLFAKTLKKKWHHFKHYEHIYHFNPKALKYILKEAGFEALSMSTKNSGKYIEVEFLIERSRRMLPKFASIFLGFFLKPFKDKKLYANMHDELILVCKQVKA